MTAQPHEPLTQAEFPAWEHRQAARHEFVDGHVYGIAGGTVGHSAIASFLIQAIGPAALPCRTYGSDVLVEMATSTRYPDIVVTCDERDRLPENTTIRHPKLVIEVLSESTAREDLGPKMREYQAIETLEEYLTVDSRKRWAQIARRDGAAWMLSTPVTSGSIGLQSIAFTLDLDALYAAAGIA
jgi:Uma2 family endonuclease